MDNFDIEHSVTTKTLIDLKEKQDVLLKELNLIFDKKEGIDENDVVTIEHNGRTIGLSEDERDKLIKYNDFNTKIDGFISSEEYLKYINDSKDIVNQLSLLNAS